MRISLVIPAHNEESYIGGCLESVISHGQGVLHEILVIDNASSDKTAAIAGGFPGVRVIREEQKGLTYARQRGLMEATGDLIAYIDADTRMPKEWLPMVLKMFAERSDIVSLSGPGRYWDATRAQRTALSLSWWISAPLMYRVVGYMIYGAHFAARKSALQAIGGFDRGIEFYGEDTDIARRLSSQGKVLFRMDFFIYSSARRFQADGLLNTNLLYTLNFIWPVLFGRPFTRTHHDVRSTPDARSIQAYE